MFRRFFKKPQVRHDDEPASQIQDQNTQPKDLTSEIKITIHCFLDGNAKPSLLYAQAQGHSRDKIDYNNITPFHNALQKQPDEMLEENKHAAEKWIENELIFCLNDYWEHYFFSPMEDNRNKYGYREIEKLYAEAKKHTIASLWHDPKRSIGQFALEAAIDKRSEDLGKVFAILEDKKDVLRPLFSRALANGKNKYGETDYTKFIHECRDFLDHFFPEGALKFFYSVQPISEVGSYVLDRWFSEALDEDTRIPDDGIEFEYWCAERLEEQGWRTTVSKSSGDQGVDVIAQRDNAIVAVQCKRYTKPIGNKAVQEVYAGQRNTDANFACIIGTGGFTAAAEELASKTSVFLLDANDIHDFSRHFGFNNLETGAGAEADSQTPSLPEGLGSHSLSLNTEAQRELGKVFRNVALNLTPHLSNIEPNIILENISSETGAGRLELDDLALGELLIFSGLVLKSHVELSEENIAAIEAERPSFAAELRDSDRTSVMYIEIMPKNLRELLRRELEDIISMLPIKPDVDFSAFEIDPGP